VDEDGRRHVLVVEDEQDLASLLRLNLQFEEFQVTVVGDGQQALDEIRRTPVDVVLLDVMMPVKSGWEVLHELKADPEYRDIPVIMLTAMAAERDLIRGHLQGAVHYITKPFDMTHLLATIEDSLAPLTPDERAGRRRLTRELVQRLAELDSGRPRGGPQVALSRLERLRDRHPATPQVDSARLDELTPHQRYVAEQLASGRGARALAEELDVSRSNIYATRKRVARKLGVTPDEVAEETARLLGR
jgi:DNA-binding response OmpR family regulator